MDSIFIISDDHYLLLLRLCIKIQRGLLQLLVIRGFIRNCRFCSLLQGCQLGVRLYHWVWVVRDCRFCWKNRAHEKSV